MTVALKAYAKLSFSEVSFPRYSDSRIVRLADDVRALADRTLF